jgi:UDP-N-acetylmuramoylalanine--D-glutamate ligase
VEILQQDPIVEEKAQNYHLPSWLTSAKSIAIVGFGREGQSTYRFLRTHLPKSIHINTYDENMDQKMRDLGHQLALEFDDKHFIGNTSLEHLFGTEDVIFKTPGIPLSKLHFHEHAKEKIYLTSQADLFMQLFGSQTIGITGTKGKSTTSHAIAEVLNATGHAALLVGNIGTPALDAVDRMTTDTTAVFELSAFQCESLHVAPHIGIFTSLYQDHLDYYQTMDAYVAAKKHLFDLQTKDDLCLYRDDDPTLFSILQACPAQKIGYRQSDRQGEVNYIPAKKIALMLGVKESDIESALSQVRPLPGRLENVGTYNEITFYDDALATIPEASIRAIKTLGQVDTLFVGGFDRHQAFDMLVEKIGSSTISTVVLFPQTGETIGRQIQRKFPRIRCIEANSMEEAVRAAYEFTPRGGIVLLSTASPSFGMFKDYADRSKQYVHWIKKLSAL